MIQFEINFQMCFLNGRTDDLLPRYFGIKMKRSIMRNLLLEELTDFNFRN